MEPDVNCAIRKGYFQQVRFLLELGSSPNCRDDERRTPLMTCALIEDEPWGVGVARTLVEKSASMTLRCARGMTALHYACIYGRADLVGVLLKSADFDIVQTDRHGNTPLHYAGTKGHVAMINTLLDAMRKYNIGLDKVNHAGMTALMLAWRSDQEQCAKLLLSRGADVTPRDYAELKTASDYEEDFRERQRTRQRRGGGTRSRGFFLNLPQYRRPVSAMSRMSGSTRSSHSGRYSAQLTRSRPVSAHLLQRRTRRTDQVKEDTPEEDFLERAEKDRAAGHVIHSASQSDLRNKPDQLLNISPLECFVKDSRYQHPSTLSLYKDSQNNNNSWKTDIKKMYTAFQFQFTKSYCRPAQPKEVGPSGVEEGRGSPVHSDYDGGGEKGKKQRKSSSKSNLSVDDKTDKKSRKSSGRSLSRKSSNVSLTSLKSQQTLVDCSSNESVNSTFRNVKKRNNDITGESADVTGLDKNGKMRSRKLSAALEDHVGMVDQSVRSTSRGVTIPVVKEPPGQDHLGAIRE